MADAPTGKVTFVGAGPGAADLLTFRAARAIADADVVIWAASLVQGRFSSTRARARRSSTRRPCPWRTSSPCTSGPAGRG